ncbi:MAG: LytTR family DNA-binding domain-containing protein [Lachnospiraceae bacterium]|nr:LytTR family DNA-binding domain-containing protein [Lachnospiraceae bacterium]
MLQIAICDDEQFYRDKMKRLLDRYMQRREMPYELHVFLSGKEFLEQCENSVKFNIVFLDINMEEMDGIQTAERIRSFHSDTYIVFVTAFIDYALEGYKVNAVRYLMKDNLEGALEECMRAILQKMQVAQVNFVFMEGEKKLYTDNILYVESRGHKSIFHYMEDEETTYQIYDKLDVIEEKLAGYRFLRIHKSYLVNMKHIRRINNYTAFLDTGEELPIPRPRFQMAKESFVDYKGAM